ncbi:MAG: AAA family ATPase [Deltaproteobacteria bacterium]|jgi:class 3 adenylate cyclase/tetratricopeptide (TPR) repeat protein|nr:AAA family ATPase [Deltaproteobacteria bacterium]MBW2542435.1 AAA family ATPase [Deltaproteobacteria bacterium]
MNCLSCEHLNPETARFCNRCGTALEISCNSCSQSNPPASRFCNHCGSSLAEPVAEGAPTPRDYTPKHLAERILRQKAALEGERKHVTVLFADLANSTELAAQLGPEKMHALMDRAFQCILAEVHRYEGTVNQFTGDGVMALFGAPLALEDAPRKAVIAALAIHRALEGIDAEVRNAHGRSFAMRIGINTGPVVVGKIGDDLRMDYTAVGDTTNLAARLEQLAAPGGVVVSESTRRLGEGYFDFCALEPTAVKGKGAAIQAFEVLAKRTASGRIDVLTESGLTPFVGREAESAALFAAFESARAGLGQLAFLVGEAGLGKSRLLYEFRRRLADVPHSWFEGRCASFAQTTPFYAVIDGIRRRAGIDDQDDDAAIAEKLANLELDAGGGLEWTLPFMRRLLSLPSGDARVDALDAMTRRSECSRALQARFLREAKQQPLVLVIEDFHWIDAASEEFLSFLADSIPAAPVLLIFTHRPGYEHPFGDRSFHVRIPLRALSQQATRQMVQSVLESDELPLALQQMIANKAEGNPLFIEEVVRSLLEEGVVSVEGGVPHLARDLGGINVPDRIQDVLMARLDRLPDGPKHAIQIASVIGREFALRLLERITEAGDQLSEIVGELRALELIYEKASYPELAYMFKHALTHDVAYESVLVQRRKMLHQIVGTAIEELYPDRIQEHYEALAHHFSEAEDWERALRYHELASEKSQATYANRAASDHCRSAIAIAEKLGDRVTPQRRHALLQRLAVSCWHLSEFRASAEAFRQAAACAESSPKRALMLGRAAFSYHWNHDYEKSRELEGQARELAEAHEATAAIAYSQMVHDERELVHGRGLGDDAQAEAAAMLAERSGDMAVYTHLLQHIGQRAEWRGEFRRAIEYTQRAVKISTDHRMPGESLFGQWFLAIASVAAGEYNWGFGLLRAALELSDRIGDRAVKARLLNTVGWSYAELGCHAQAIEHNRMGTEIAREMVKLGLVAGAPELYANAAVNLAGNLTALGEIEAAAEQLAAIQEQHDTDEDPWMRWRWSLHLQDGLARVDLARGDAERALERADAEIAGARERCARKLEARALELRGRSLVFMDRCKEAEPALREALVIATHIEHPPVAWRALSLIGEVARRRGDSELAERYFSEVRTAVKEKAASIKRAELSNGLRAMGERLVADPLAAYR